MNPRSIPSLLKAHGPVTLAREAAWRFNKLGRIARMNQSLAAIPTGLRFEPLPWQSPLAQSSPSDLAAFADHILRGEFPLMGYGNPQLGLPPNWHTDWVSGKSWPQTDSSTLQLVRHDNSDVKAPWELSRLQFLPVLAHAWSATKDPQYRDCVWTLLVDWLAQNPISIGVNWTLAMEASLRSISICLALNTLAPFSDAEQPALHHATESLWQHLAFIQGHNEFSHLLTSNHYLSNVAGVCAIAAFLRAPGLDSQLAWAHCEAEREILKQTYADGGDFEASTGYHLLVWQLFSFIRQSLLLRSVATSEAYNTRLEAMSQWMATLADDSGALPHLGDCDDARVELLPDDIAHCNVPLHDRHSLRLPIALRGTSNTPQSEPTSPSRTVLPHSGIAVLRNANAQAWFCAMPNGIVGKGSHTHSDKLAVLLRIAGHDVFVDAGTRCYTRDAAFRNLYRSVNMHNTVSVDGEEQNRLPANPRELFRLIDDAHVSPIESACSDDSVSAESSHTGYHRLGFDHHRRVELGSCSLRISDTLNLTSNHRAAPPYRFQLNFLLGPEFRASLSPSKYGAASLGISIDGPVPMSITTSSDHTLTASVEPSEFSRAYASSQQTQRLVISTEGALLVVITTEVTWSN